MRIAVRGFVAIGLLVAMTSACDHDPPRRSDRADTRETRQERATTRSTAPVDPSNTFKQLLKRAGGVPGTVHLTVTLPDGEEIPLAIAEDALELLGSMELSEKIFVSCPPPGRACGDAEPTAYATESLPRAQVVRSLRGGDGQPVQLVEHPAGRALRYVRSGWTLQVLLVHVPRSEYSRWASGLAPVLNEDGWLQVQTSRGLRIGTNPVATLLSKAAQVRLIPGTTCSPANHGETAHTRPDGGPYLFADECDPTTGIVISADGEPDVVRRLVSAISVR